MDAIAVRKYSTGMYSAHLYKILITISTKFVTILNKYFNKQVIRIVTNLKKHTRNNSLMMTIRLAETLI